MGLRVDSAAAPRTAGGHCESAIPRLPKIQCDPFLGRRRKAEVGDPRLLARLMRGEGPIVPDSAQLLRGGLRVVLLLKE